MHLAIQNILSKMGTDNAKGSMGTNKDLLLELPITKMALLLQKNSMK